VTATFTQITYALTVSTVGQGTVSRSPDQASYASGSTVQLTATPASGWSFSSWSGDASGSSSSLAVSMTGNKAVTATFTQNTYTVTASTVGQGTVSKTPSQATYTYGASVQLTATPTAGWVFTGWGGDLSGSVNPATLTVDGNKAVTATFTQIHYTLTISVTGSGSTNPAAGSSNYASGSIIQVAATPSSGWQFSHWHLDGVDSGSTSPATVTMNSAHTLEAVFTSTGVTPTHILSVTGSTYYSQVVATGATTSSTSIQTLVDRIPNGAVVLVKSGTYYLPVSDGLVVANKNNVSFYGESGTIFKVAMPTPTVVGQVLDNYHSSNIQFSDVTFDMDYPNNPNNLGQTSYGTGWGARTGPSNNSFIRCQFLNIAGSGLVVSGTGHHVIDCIFNHLTEHTLYISDAFDLHVEGCTFLNYGKLGRGYGPKIQESHDLYFDNCYYEPNQDGTGFKSWSYEPSETGARGVIIAHDDNLFFTNCKWFSDSPNPYIVYPIYETTNSESHNINFTDCMWTNFGQPVFDSPSGTYYSHNIAETHFTNCAFK